MNLIQYSSLKVEELLIKGAEELGICLTSDQVSLFLGYLKKIEFWNEKVNLIGARDARQIVLNHFLDSIAVVPFVSEGSRLLDIGSGAGFPGIPIKIVIPSLEIMLLDSVQKKAFFMRDVIRSLGLKSIKAVYGRAEDIIDEVPRAYFDFVISRAVGNIEKVIKLSIPYLREGGRIILMRGKRGLEEWDKIRDRLGQDIRLVLSKEFSLPFIGYQRVILVIARVL
jgi:16S rRNA (guanine527-N7)-methyltransferase